MSRIEIQPSASVAISVFDDSVPLCAGPDQPSKNKRRLTFKELDSWGQLVEDVTFVDQWWNHVLVHI